MENKNNNKVIKKTTTTTKVVVEPVEKAEEKTAQQPAKPQIQYVYLKEAPKKQKKTTKKATLNPEAEKAKKTFIALGRTSAAFGFMSILLYVVYVIGIIWIVVINGVKGSEEWKFASMLNSFTWTINIMFLVANAILMTLGFVAMAFVAKMNKFAPVPDRSPYVVWGIAYGVIIIFIATGIMFAVVASQDAGQAYVPLLMFIPTTAGDLTVAIFTIIKVKSALKGWGRKPK